MADEEQQEFVPPHIENEQDVEEDLGPDENEATLEDDLQGDEEEAEIVPKEEDDTMAAEDEEAPEDEEDQSHPERRDESQDDQPSSQPAAPSFGKVFKPITRPAKRAAAAEDPAAAIIAGGWTATATSHDFNKSGTTRNGVDTAAQRGRLVVNPEIGIQGREMTTDTNGMQKLYSRMLTTKMWW